MQLQRACKERRRLERFLDGALLAAVRDSTSSREVYVTGAHGVSDPDQRRKNDARYAFHSHEYDRELQLLVQEHARLLDGVRETEKSVSRDL